MTLQDWPHSKAGKIVTRLGVLAALTLGILTLFEGIWIAGSDIRTLRGVEQNVVFSIQKYMHTHQLYTDPSSPPFGITQYSPVYYIAIAGICNSIGIEPHDAESVTAIARSFSLFCSVVLLALIYKFMRCYFQVPRLISLIACAFIFSLTAPCYFLARPDSLMALFFLATVTCAVRSTSSSRTGYSWIALAALFALLATATKQNGLHAFAILLIFLVITRQVAKLLIMLGVFTMGSLLVLLSSYSLLGIYLKENVIDGINNGINVHLAILNCYTIFFPMNAFLLAVVLIVITSWFRSKQLQSHKTLLMAIGTVFIFFFATITALKTGSGRGYYNEFIILATISVAAYLAHERQLQKSQNSFPLVASIISAYLLFSLTYWSAEHYYKYVYVNSQGWTFVPSPSRQLCEYDDEAHWLRERLALAPQPSYVLSFVSWLDNFLPEYAVAPQKDLVDLAFTRNTVDYTGLRELIQSGKVRYIITQEGQLPEEFVGIRLDSYIAVAKLGRFNVYQHPLAGQDSVVTTDFQESQTMDYYGRK